MLGEQPCRALLHRDGDAKQVVGIARSVLDAAEQRGQIQPQRGQRRDRGHVVAARERLHVLALHHREAAEQIAHLRIGAVGRGALIERAAAQLDLEGHSHAGQRDAVRRGGSVSGHQMAAAGRAGTVGERKPLVFDLGSPGNASAGSLPRSRCRGPRRRIPGACGIAGIAWGFLSATLAWRAWPPARAPNAAPAPQPPDADSSTAWPCCASGSTCCCTRLPSAASSASSTRWPINASRPCSAMGLEFVPLRPTPISASDALAQRQHRSHAGQRKVHRSAHTRLAIAAAARRVGGADAHRGDELADGQREVRRAVVAVQVVQRHATRAAGCGDLDLGACSQQHRCHVAAERGVAALALRRHVAGVAAALQAPAVAGAPPFALVVVDAARVLAQVAAQRGHAAMAGAGHRACGLRQRGQVTARRARHRPIAPASTPAPMVSAPSCNSITSRPATRVRSTSCAGCSRPWRRLGNRSVPPASARAPAASSCGRFARCGGPLQHELWQGAHACSVACVAARRARSRCSRWRAWIASNTRSGVIGSSRARMPMASHTAAASAGAKPCSAPSLASLAPNGPSGSMLSISVTSIGGDSAIVGMR